MWNESLIKSFLILAQTGSFSEAARNSYFTQQAISKQIAHLEKELNTTLFLRSHSGVELTQAGKIYYDAFQKVMELIGQAGREVARLERGQEVRVGYLEMLVLDPVWHEFTHAFRQRHPEISLRIESFSDAEIHRALEEGTVEAAIVLSNGGDQALSGFRTIPIGSKEVKLQLCVNRNYPGAAEATSYRDLDGIPILSPNWGEEWAADRVRNAGLRTDRIEFRPNISSALLSVNMLEGGILVGDHCEFRNSPDLLFFPTEVHGQFAFLVWDAQNQNPALRRMLEEFQEFSGLQITE